MTQASYQSYDQPSGCASCGCGAQTANYGAQYSSAASPQPIVAGPGTTVIQQNGGPTTESRPNMGSSQQTPPENTYRKPPDDSQQPTLQPQPGTNSPYEVPKKNDNSTYLEAPKLFNPQDRTAQRSIAPVRTALYQQPTSYREISTARTPITTAQAQQDAIGWTSASN